MGQPLFEFTALDDVDGLYAAASGDLRCTAIRLRTGGLCLFSPVQGLGERALATLAELGPVEILLAPNHYHNKGLKEYAKAFPRSLVCAPDSAVPRLEKVTGLRFEGLRKLSSRLPGNMKLVAPDGLKTGEVWISARGTVVSKFGSSWMHSADRSKARRTAPDRQACSARFRGSGSPIGRFI